MDSVFMTGFTYFSAAIYPWLYFLNLFWFHKMIKAAMKFIQGEDELEKGSKSPSRHDGLDNEEEKVPLVQDEGSLATA